MNETLFYVFGIGLTAAALIVTAVGLRWEKFPPSKPVMALVTLVFLVGVGGTAVFGWANAEDEQDHREQELAEATEENQAEGDEAEAGEEGGSLSEPPDTALVDLGATVFEAQGCGGCHTFGPAGSTGTTGPALDSTLAGKDAAYVEQAIVDPNAEIVEGFSPDVMPQTYGDLPAEELDGLVQYLVEGAGAGSSGS